MIGHPVMYALMIAMHICSNGRPVSRAALAEQERHWPGSDGPLARLMYHRALWRMRGFHSYQYTLSRRGTGVPGSDISVRVQAGEVVSVCALDGTPQTEVPAEYACEIDEYFRLVGRALSAGKGSVMVDYHPIHGYPLSITMTGSESIAELAAESGYHTA